MILSTSLKTVCISVFSCACLLPVMAHANCSRVINVPVAAAGLSVIVNDKNVSGIYPELLRSMSDSHGCNFAFSSVPRARLELMFASGKADLMIPAKKTAKRDEYGVFIPLIFNRAELISLSANLSGIKSMQDLIERRDLRVALVRGYDYGPAYQLLAAELTKQGRLVLEAEPTSIARLLKAGTVDVTIMTPYIFVGALHGDARIEDMASKINYEPMAELPWSDSGAYISKSALNDADKASLRNLLESAAKSGVIWKSFQRYYPAELLKDSIRPLDAPR